jgi:hypothetical protein
VARDPNHVVATLPAGADPANWRANEAWDGVEPNPARAVTRDMVDVEYRARLAVGFTYGGNLFDFNEDSRVSILGAVAAAQRHVQLAALDPAVAIGKADWLREGTDFTFTDATDAEVPLTAMEMIALGMAAAEHLDSHHDARRALKAMDPIPADYTDDIYWP